MKKIASLLFGLLMISSVTLNAGKVSSKVTSIKGTATYFAPGSIFAKKIIVDTKIPSGSIVKTGDDTEVVIAVTPGASMQIGSNTTVSLNDMEYEVGEDGVVKSRKARIQLASGTISSLLDDKTPEATDFRVQTPQGTAAARGTFYGVSVVDGKTFVKVENGKVGFVKREKDELDAGETIK
jgi:hypothetical protein